MKAKLSTIGRWLMIAGVPVAAGVAAFLLLLVLASMGVYEQHHVTAHLRRTLLVALAPDAPDDVILDSLRRARRERRTWRDHREYDKLRCAVEAMATAQAGEVALGRRLRQGQAQLDAEIHSERLMIVTEQAYLESHQAMPAGLADDVAGEQLRRERARNQRRREDDRRWLQLLQLRLNGLVMMQELRVELGVARPPS